MESWLFSYYRTILSSFSKDNTHDQNILLLNELNDVQPNLINEAYELILKRNIVKYQYKSKESNYSFYIMKSDKECLTVNGYCTCFKFRDNVLIKDKELTCVHEIVSIILDYIDPNMDPNIEKILEKTVYLDELEFITKLQLYSTF